MSEITEGGEESQDWDGRPAYARDMLELGERHQLEETIEVW